MFSRDHASDRIECFNDYLNDIEQTSERDEKYRENLTGSAKRIDKQFHGNNPKIEMPDGKIVNTEVSVSPQIKKIKVSMYYIKYPLMANYSIIKFLNFFDSSHLRG